MSKETTKMEMAQELVNSKKKEVKIEIKVSKDESLEQEKVSLMQPVCEGSRQFCAIAWICICLLFLAPIALIVVGSVVLIHTPIYGPDIGYIICSIGVLLLLGGIFWCCISMGPLCRKIPTDFGKPEKLFPLRNSEMRSVKLKKVYMILNPLHRPGQLDAEEIYDRFVKSVFLDEGIEVVTIMTERAGHAHDICATTALNGIDAIIAIGGDGTFHEMINGLKSRSDGKTVPLGLIPGGSGNSFLTDFGFHDKPAEMAKAIVKGNVAEMDLNRVILGPDESTDVKYSMNTIVLCKDHCLMSANIDSWRGCLGSNRYDVCSLWGLLKNRYSNINITVDGEKFAQDVCLCVLNNTQHAGKGMRIAPLAQHNDGKFDILCLGKTKRAQFLKLFLNVKDGSHYPLAKNAKGKCAVFHLPIDKGLINIDGEITIHKIPDIQVDCVKAGFDFLSPLSFISDTNNAISDSVS